MSTASELTWQDDRTVKIRLRILLAVFGAVVLIVGSFHLWYYVSWVWPASPDQLADRALNGDSPEERGKAAVRLAECGYQGVEQMRRVLNESNDPAVRATCIEGLGSIWDYESMDLFVELLEDESRAVRGAAGTAVTVMVMGHDPRFRFRADDPDDKRQQAIDSLTTRWEDLNGSPILKRHIRILEQQRK